MLLLNALQNFYVSSTYPYFASYNDFSTLLVGPHSIEFKNLGCKNTQFVFGKNKAKVKDMVKKPKKFSFLRQHSNLTLTIGFCVILNFLDNCRGSLFVLLSGIHLQRISVALI